MKAKKMISIYIHSAIDKFDYTALIKKLKDSNAIVEPYVRGPFGRCEANHVHRYSHIVVPYDLQHKENIKRVIGEILLYRDQDKTNFYLLGPAIEDQAFVADVNQFIQEKVEKSKCSIEQMVVNQRWIKIDNLQFAPEKMYEDLVNEIGYQRYPELSAGKNRNVLQSSYASTLATGEDDGYTTCEEMDGKDFNQYAPTETKTMRNVEFKPLPDELGRNELNCISAELDKIVEKYPQGCTYATKSQIAILLAKLESQSDDKLAAENLGASAGAITQIEEKILTTKQEIGILKNTIKETHEKMSSTKADVRLMKQVKDFVDPKDALNMTTTNQRQQGSHFEL